MVLPLLIGEDIGVVSAIAKMTQGGLGCKSNPAIQWTVDKLT
jgi:hypothetical protein